MWIDAHIHIYDITRKGVSWPTAKEPALYRTVGPDDFLAVAAPCGVSQAIAIECAAALEDNLWTMDSVKDRPEIAAVTGHIDPCSEKFHDLYDRYTTYKKFRGIRIGSWSPCTDLERLTRNIAYLSGKKANVVDLLGHWHDLAKMEALVHACPGVSFVIDHLAGCLIDGGPPSADYVTFLRQMAACQNVFMKTSGLVFRTSVLPVADNVDYYVPVLKSVVLAFGIERCIYGSDWPVISIKSDYQTNLQITMDFFSRYGSQALEQVMGLNAARIYQGEAT